MTDVGAFFFNERLNLHILEWRFHRLLRGYPQRQRGLVATHLTIIGEDVRDVKERKIIISYVREVISFALVIPFYF